MQTSIRPADATATHCHLFSKIQIGFTFLVPAHLGSSGQRAVKRMCLLHGRTPRLCTVSQYRLCGVVSLSRFLSEHGQSHAHTDSLKQLKANLTRHVAFFSITV